MNYLFTTNEQNDVGENTVAELKELINYTLVRSHCSKCGEILQSEYNKTTPLAWYIGGEGEEKDICCECAPDLQYFGGKIQKRLEKRRNKYKSEVQKFISHLTTKYN
jgi:hypothetical protein